MVNLKSGYSFEASMSSSPSSKFIESPLANRLCMMDIGMSSGGGKAATIEKLIGCNKQYQLSVKMNEMLKRSKPMKSYS